VIRARRSLHGAKALVVVACTLLLWSSGNAPDAVIGAVVRSLHLEEWLTQREILVLITVSAMWLTIFVYAVQMVGRLMAKTLNMIDTEARKLSPADSWRSRPFLFLFIAAAAVLPRVSLSTSDITDDAHLSNGEEAPDLSAATNSATPISNSTGTLPALLSAGLAVGLAARLQHDRMLLLADSPRGARLLRPSGPSLSQGKLLFRQARTDEASTLIDRAKSQRGFAQPSDTIEIPIGRANERSVFLTVGRGETVSIEAPPDEAISMSRYLVNTMSLATWLPHRVIVTHGFSEEDLIMAGNVIVANTSGEALTVAQRARQQFPQSAVVLLSAECPESIEDISAAGIAVIYIGSSSQQTTTQIIRRHHEWMCSHPETMFRPFGMTSEDVRQLRRSIRDMLQLDAQPLPPTMQPSDWCVLTRTLGPVDVETLSGTEVRFQRSKSVELLCWLLLHRDRPTVSAARTALWEVDVEDATFHNVLSELRRGLSRVGLAEAVRRSSKHRLCVSEQIVLDAELLRLSLARLEREESRPALNDVREVLSLVRGLPFEASNFAWADAEGITSSFVWLVNSAIDRVAGLALAMSEKSMAYDAVSIGLRMSPGDERLIATQRELVGERNPRLSTG
jgi:hypothetical protein